MRGLWLLLAVLLVAPATAQSVAGLGLTLLVFHPYPDPADPLGFAAPGSGRDPYALRYAHLDAEGDGFDFPHMVMDGVHPVEGLPDPQAPFVSTLDAYTKAFQDRQVATPVTLTVDGRLGDGLSATVTAEAVQDLDGLHLWVAAVEDHVHYAPPPSLSNGVVDHRFVVRDVADLGVLPLPAGTPVAWNVTLALPGDAVADQVYVAAWLQNGAQEGLFAPHEVVQATLDPVRDGVPTVQAAKGVLMQLYSATWCDPCLIGDRAAERLAADFGVATVDPVEAHAGYLVAPAAPVAVLLLAVGAGLWVAFARLPGGRP